MESAQETAALIAEKVALKALIFVDMCCVCGLDNIGYDVIDDWMLYAFLIAT